MNEQTLAGDNQELDAPRAVDVTPNHAADELDVGRVLAVLNVHNDACKTEQCHYVTSWPVKRTLHTRKIKEVQVRDIGRDDVQRNAVVRERSSARKIVHGTRVSRIQEEAGVHLGMKHGELSETQALFDLVGVVEWRAKFDLWDTFHA